MQDLEFLEFEWNEEKNLSNLVKHGFSFEDAKEIFAGNYVIIPSNQNHMEGDLNKEQRFIGVGKLEEEIYIAVIYTIRNDTIRIISARNAKNKEIKLLKLT